LAIGEKLFKEKITPVGFAIKSVGSEGVESEYSVTGEIIGFGKAQRRQGHQYGTTRNLSRPSGITTGIAQGIMTTTDGDSVVWKLSYAGKSSGAGGKLTGTVTFTTVSEKLSWLNRTICVMEGKGEADPTKVGTNVFHEWS